MNPAVSLISQNTADTKNGSISFRFRYWLCKRINMRKNIQNNALILHNIKKYQRVSENAQIRPLKCLFLRKGLCLFNNLQIFSNINKEIFAP